MNERRMLAAVVLLGTILFIARPGFAQPISSCPDEGSCAELTIRYVRQRAFKGTVWNQTYGRCERYRKIIVKKKRYGTDLTVGSDMTNEKANWKVEYKDANGRFYAKAPVKTFSAPNGEERRCRRLLSVTIRVR